MKAYTVNNTTDLCGGLRFSWSEWISLSTLLRCSLSNEKEKRQWLPRKSHVVFLKRNAKRSLSFSCHTSEGLATNALTQPRNGPDHAVIREGCLHLVRLCLEIAPNESWMTQPKPIVILLLYFLAVKTSRCWNLL